MAYRDFRYVVPFAMQAWMFATPSVYLPVDGVVGPIGQWVMPLNPAYGLILTARAMVLGSSLDGYALAVSGAVAVAFLLLGCLYFRRVERTFADTI